MWSDSDKERFYDQVKQAVLSGATPQELIKELEIDYYEACNDLKRSAVYIFNQLLKRD